MNYNIYPNSSCPLAVKIGQYFLLIIGNCNKKVNVQLIKYLGTYLFHVNIFVQIPKLQYIALK